MYKLANRLSESQKQLAIFAAIYIGTAILLVHLFPLLARLNSGNCDPWYYFGPMLTADLFPPQGRVALTFPTYIFGKLFGIDYLETFYFVSTISVIAVSTFAALRMLFDPISAAFASAITGLSGYVLNVSSTTYSSPGLAYGCIAFWLLCKSLYSGHLTGTYLPLFFSGFALSWAFNVHPVAFAVLAPLYIVALGAKKAPAAVVWRLDAAIIVAILGFIVGTLAIGLIGYLLYGRFFDSCFRQFMEIYGTFHGGVHYNLNRWLVGDWWHEDSIFQILIFLLATSVFFALRSMPSSYDPKILCAIGAGVSGAVFLVLNLANATVVLSYPYYIIYFFLPLSICLCLIFNLLVKKCWPKEPSTRFFTGALLIQSGVLVCILWLNWHLRVNFSWRSQTVLTVAALTLSVAALVLVEWSRRGARLLVLGLCLALFPLAVQSFKYTNYGRTLWIARVGGMREQYWVIKRAIRFISEETRGAFPNFWISPSANQEVATGLFRSYNRCGFLPGFPVKLPDPEVQWQHKLVPGEFLVIVTAVGQPLDPGRKLLLQHGLNFERVGSKKFVQGGFSIAVHVVKLIRGA